MQQRLAKNREEILKQKHKRENSIDVNFISILFINMNTIYNTSQERKLSGFEAIQMAHNKAGLDVTNSPNLDMCQSQLIVRGHEWKKLALVDHEWLKISQWVDLGEKYGSGWG